MIALIIVPSILAYLAGGSLVARWQWGRWRAQGIDERANYVSPPRDPVKDWLESSDAIDSRFLSGIAFALWPAWGTVLAITVFVGGTGRLSEWERKREHEASRKRLEELERENERWRKVAGA